MKKYIITIIMSAIFVFNTNLAKAQLPTVDFGNLAGTIGIVTQGITNVQQGIDSIKNASNFLSVVGDAVGTISKFASKIKGYVQDAQAAIEKAKQRISEGVELYNKYKGEIEDRKAKYQELLASIPNYKNPNSYDDGSSNNTSSSSGNNTPSSNNQSSSGVNSSSSSSSGSASSNKANTNRQSPANTNTNYRYNNTPTQTNSGYNATRNNASQISPSRNTGVVAPYTTTEKTPSLADEAAAAAAAAREDASNKKDSLFNDEDLNVTYPSETINEKENNAMSKDVGRKAFSNPSKDVQTAKDSAVDTTLELPATKSNTKAVSSPVSTTKGTESLSTKSSSVSSSKDKEISPSKSSVPAAEKSPQTPTFRQSPTIEKRSQNTIYYSTRLSFAAETNNSAKGSGYDKNGVFIFDVKYCDKSVDDMLTEKGARECLVNIINKINDENTHYAAANREDCQKMIFETSVALLKEALVMVNDASNYQDTLDEQEQMGGNSNNTRDDTQVLVMSYEQTQLLLNKLTLILSAQTVLNVTKDICDAPISVLEKNEVETSSGGK